MNPSSEGLIYTSVCDHSGTATANGVARSELIPPCSGTGTRVHARAHTCATHRRLTHTCVHQSIAAWKVFQRDRGKGGGGSRSLSHMATTASFAQLRVTGFRGQDPSKNMFCLIYFFARVLESTREGKPEHTKIERFVTDMMMRRKQS